MRAYIKIGNDKIYLSNKRLSSDIPALIKKLGATNDSVK
jgi:hypothetical protein